MASNGEPAAREVGSGGGDNTTQTLGDDLLQRLWCLLQLLIQDRVRNPHNLFNEPVPPELAPGYYSIITSPMDLGTVRSRLEDGYYQNASALAQDVRLVFANAMRFNKETDMVHAYARELLGIFEAEFAKVQDATSSRSCRCCRICNQGELFLVQTSVLTCSVCQAQILGDGTAYYRVGNDRGQHWCLACYQVLPPTFTGAMGQILDKHMLERHINALSHPERWVGDAHEICIELQAARPFRASQLPMSALADYVQSKLRAAAVKELCRDPPSPGHAVLNPKFAPDEAEAVANTLHCRVLSCLDFEQSGVVEGARLKRWIDYQCRASQRESRDMLEAPQRRRERALGVFQSDSGGGLDILCFVLYVQEYADCIYISYLDSCAYIAPRRLRAVTYQQCLMAYFAWAQQSPSSFKRVYLWASPPAEGDAYVFNVHPRWQRNPTPERLKKWYAAIYKACKREGIFKAESTLYDVHLANYKPFVRTRRTAAQYTPVPHKLTFGLHAFPLFSGDYCHGALETILCRLESCVPADCVEEGLELRVQHWWHAVWGKHAIIEQVQAEAEDAAAYIVRPSVDECVSIDTLLALEREACTYDDRDEWIMRKLAELIRTQKDAFIVYEFKPFPDASTNKRARVAATTTVNCEDNMPPTIFTNRLGMLDSFHAQHLQFDTKRRARHSTQVLLSSLFKDLNL